MTKTEFASKINTAYNEALQKYADVQKLKEMLSKYSDKDGKISTENLAVFAFMESVRLNQMVLSSVLEEVLEFDD